MASEDPDNAELQPKMNADRQAKSHPIFTTDPMEWMQYVHHEVCVTTEDGATHTGWVYTVDPVSQSVALINFNSENENKTLKVIMGHVVQSIVILNEDSSAHRDKMENLFRPPSAIEISPEEMKQRKEKLKSWLLKNRIPVQITGNNSELLSISDALFIEPPYGPENCQSTNEIILGRVQGLIKNMPPDVDEW